MRNVPFSLRHLNTWSPVGDAVLGRVRQCSRGGGGVSLVAGFVCLDSLLPMWVQHVSQLPGSAPCYSTVMDANWKSK